MKLTAASGVFKVALIKTTPERGRAHLVIVMGFHLCNRAEVRLPGQEVVRGEEQWEPCSHGDGLHHFTTQVFT